MSDSVRPHSWDSPGKNTEEGCHLLLQRIKVKSESEVTQSRLTLRDPMDCSLPGSCVHGIFQARVLEWGASAIHKGHYRAQKNWKNNFRTGTAFSLCILPTGWWETLLMEAEAYTLYFLLIHLCQADTLPTHPRSKNAGSSWS